MSFLKRALGAIRRQEQRVLSRENLRNFSLSPRFIADALSYESKRRGGRFPIDPKHLYPILYDYNGEAGASLLCPGFRRRGNESQRIGNFWCVTIRNDKEINVPLGAFPKESVGPFGRI